MKLLDWGLCLRNGPAWVYFSHDPFGMATSCLCAACGLHHNWYGHTHYGLRLFANSKTESRNLHPNTKDTPSVGRAGLTAVLQPAVL